MPHLPIRLRCDGQRSPGWPTAVAAIDPLERRTLLAATLTPDGVLLVTGTEAADTFAVRLNSTGTDLQVQGAGPGLSLFLLSAVRSVRVQGGGGDDTLTVDTGRGLVARADAALPITFDGGAGADTAILTGAPAGVSVSETITFGPAADAGKVVSRDGTRTQSVEFTGVESLLDISTAASLTVQVNDGANLVELSNGATVGGVGAGSLKVFDVTPCEEHTAVAPPATASAAPASAAVVELPAVAAESSATGQSKREQAKARAEAKREAKRRAKELKAAAKAARKAQRSSGAPATPAPATPAPPVFSPTVQELVVGRAYLPVQFANKAAITINTGGGDDWVAVNHAAPPAGLKSLSVDAGEGQDHLATVATPQGAAWLPAGVEDVASTIGFVSVAECPDPPAPAPNPNPDPGPVNNPPPDDDEDDDDDDGKGKGNKGKDKDDDRDDDDDDRDEDDRDEDDRDDDDDDRGDDDDDEDEDDDD